MLMLLSIVFGIVLAGPAGGSYRHLSQADIRLPGLFVVGAVLQFALTAVLSGGASQFIPVAAWMTGAVCLVIACFINGRFWGFMVAALGIALNTLVIGLNVGMPVYSGAIQAVGIGASFTLDAGGLYHVADESTRLVMLADVVPVPGPAGVRSVASLGDLLICVGVATVIVQLALGKPRTLSGF